MRVSGFGNLFISVCLISVRNSYTRFKRIFVPIEKVHLAFCLSSRLSSLSD
jgi:hypothetical protein